MNEKELMLSLELNNVPIRFHKGLIRWVVSGIHPGGFLTSVLVNNFMHALMRCDGQLSVEDLRNLARWLNNECPVECFGSSIKFQNWRDKKEAEEKAKEERIWTKK